MSIRVTDSAPTDRQFLLHQGLVRAMAWKLHRRVPNHVELDDLVAYGQIGLLEAMRRFDKSRGLKFSTFAWLRVRGAILDGLEKMVWFDRISFEKGEYEQTGDAGSPAVKVTQQRSQPLRRCAFDESQVATAEEPPVSRLENREAVAFLMSLVGGLPEKEAGLLRGVFFEGRTLTEAARRVGISTAWASRLQNRTLSDLRLALEQHGFG